MALATGIGSMPGTDVAESFRVILSEVGDAPFVPELPARGVHAGMTGRTLALLEGLQADLQPDGWRIGVGEGSDVRRARSLLAQDLDTAEELAHELDGPLKVQVTGPLTLAATVERLRGDKMLADHGARRDLSASLAEGLGAHVADLRRRFPSADLVVQVDEPAMTAVLGGSVPTASGWARHRSVHPPEADALLRDVVDAIVAGGARPVVHTCAADVPVSLLAGAGFTALSFDLSLATPSDAWAEAFDAGVDLWPGVLPTGDAPLPTDKEAIARLDAFFGPLGFATHTYAPRVVVTPTCGLAGATSRGARAALERARSIAASLS